MTIQILNQEERMLIGVRDKMSLTRDTTEALWKRFGPIRKEIANPLNSDLISMIIYPGLQYFDSFNPTRKFEKWAALEAKNGDHIPYGCELFRLPSGCYAVFQYKGLPSQIGKFYRWILKDYLPSSQYRLDDRPHLARMGQAYKGDHHESEETLYVPVKKKITE